MIKFKNLMSINVKYFLVYSPQMNKHKRYKTIKFLLKIYILYNIYYINYLYICFYISKHNILNQYENINQKLNSN